MRGQGENIVDNTKTLSTARRGDYANQKGIYEQQKTIKMFMEKYNSLEKDENNNFVEQAIYALPFLRNEKFSKIIKKKLENSIPKEEYSFLMAWNLIQDFEYNGEYEKTFFRNFFDNVDEHSRKVLFGQIMLETFDETEQAFIEKLTGNIKNNFPLSILNSMSYTLQRKGKETALQQTEDLLAIHSEKIDTGHMKNQYLAVLAEHMQPHFNYSLKRNIAYDKQIKEQALKLFNRKNDYLSSEDIVYYLDEQENDDSLFSAYDLIYYFNEHGKQSSLDEAIDHALEAGFEQIKERESY